jgi:hypothetical protein
MSMKGSVFAYIKNLGGKRIREKCVLLAVDDYGNVFLDSKAARDNLKKAGLDIEQSRFCMYDILENAEDLSALFDVLTSVKDHEGKHAVMTPFVLSANIDFDKCERNNYAHYEYETLEETFSKRPNYAGTWNLWKEGIDRGIFIPQFHGREHLNVRLFNQLLDQKKQDLLLSLKNRSYAAIPTPSGSKVGFTEAFSFDYFDEIEEHKKIIEEGLNLFERQIGYKACHFNAPGAREHSTVHSVTSKKGIKYIDKDFYHKEISKEGDYKSTINPIGSHNEFNQKRLFRNCVFEPSLNENSDWVDVCLKNIQIAFNCGKPAIISSHRVNFVGGIEPKIREQGLKELKRLLKAITVNWPTVKFIDSKELAI